MADKRVNKVMRAARLANKGGIIVPESANVPLPRLRLAERQKMPL